MAKPLAISMIISAVDRATGPMRAIAASVRSGLGKPITDFGSKLRESSLKMSDWAWGVSKWAALGAGAAVAAIGVMTMATLDSFGALDDLSKQVGISSAALQELRYAAQLSGVDVEVFDGGIQALTKSVGQARSGTGKLAGFLTRVSPALLKQVKAAKSNEEAFDLMAEAIGRIKDPARRAALASAAFGGAGPVIARMMADGAAGIAGLREEFRKLGGGVSNEGVAALADFGDKVDRLKVSFAGLASEGIAILLAELGPSFDALRDWIVNNQSEIRQSIRDSIARLKAFAESIDWPAIKTGLLAVKIGIVDIAERLGGLEGLAKIFAAVLAVKVVAALVSAAQYMIAFASAVKATYLVLAANPIAALALALTALVAVVIYRWDDLGEFFAELWRTIPAVWNDGVALVLRVWDDLRIGVSRGLDSIVVVFGGFGETMRKAWEGFKVGISPITDAVVGVFDAAWSRIGKIVDWIMSGVREVIAGAQQISAAIGFGSPSMAAPVGVGPSGAALAIPAPRDVAAAASGGQRQPVAQVQGGIVVQFANAPAGLQVSPESGTPGLTIGAQVGRRSIME